MTNLENLENFLLEDDIDTVNKFIGERVIITEDIKNCVISNETRYFFQRLANAIKNNEIKLNITCQRNCIFRKIKD